MSKKEVRIGEIVEQARTAASDACNSALYRIKVVCWPEWDREVWEEMAGRVHDAVSTPEMPRFEDL